MAERKKRGLGRGLGALIPDANSNDRPVDVFFSGGSTEDGQAETKTPRSARTDPAASMQSSRRRKPKAGPSKDSTSNAAPSTASQSKAAEAESAETTSTGSTSASKSSSARTSASTSAGSKSTASKTRGTKSTTSKSSTSKRSTAKTGAATASGGSGSRATSAGKTTTPKTKSGSSAAAAPAENAEKAPAVAKSSTRKTSTPASVSDSTRGDSDAGTTVSRTAAQSDSTDADNNVSADFVPAERTDAQETESATAAAAAASPEDGVRETHPGVYTSSGRSSDDAGVDEKTPSADTGGDNDAETTDVVNGDPAAEPTAARNEREPVTSGATDSSSSAPAESNEQSSSSGTTEKSGESHTAEVADGGNSDEYDGVESIPDTEFGEIDVDLIDANPRQPRTVFDEDLLAELVHSIREIGVLQPVVVRQKPSDRSRFELIMGERRLRATKDAGLSTIPAIIRYVEDTDLLRDALLENLHRAELNPLEEAAAYGQLLEDFGCTQEELSERIGRSRPQISNTLRLLRLPPLVQRRVAAGVISAGHARAILGLRDPEHMEVLAQRIVAEGLSVRASEEAVVLLNRGDSINVSRATTKVAPEFLAVAERLGDRLDTKVNISVGKRKGKLSVEFANQEDLDRILSLLGISNEDAI